jgi:hypothetical protein
MLYRFFHSLKLKEKKNSYRIIPRYGTLLTTESQFRVRQLVRKVRNLEERFYDEGDKQPLYFPARKAKYRGVNVFWYRITASKSQASQGSFRGFGTTSTYPAVVSIYIYALSGEGKAYKPCSR